MNLKLSDFNYILPKSLIAQHPARPKDHSRLMIVRNAESNGSGGPIEHKYFCDIINYLNKGDVLVLNNTKVNRTKLIGKKLIENKIKNKKELGSSAEITLTKKIEKNTYECHIKTKNPVVGTKIIFNKGLGTIIEKKSVDLFVIKLSNSKILKDTKLTTPPYIKRNLNDEEYQTIFAEQDKKNKINSIAAPTAGLHFTKSLLNKIKKKGVKVVFITLHVSYGTFLPVYDLQNHRMEPEYYEISQKDADAINNRNTKQNKKSRLIVVGTTTLKALETGSKEGKIISGSGWSDKFIYPGHKFNSGLDGLITNFHLPSSTLIMLVSAFFGRENVMNIYKLAVDEKYRFYSLGDAMMLIKS